MSIDRRALVINYHYGRMTDFIKTIESVRQALSGNLSPLFADIQGVQKTVLAASLRGIIKQRLRKEHRGTPTAKFNNRSRFLPTHQTI